MTPTYTPTINLAVPATGSMNWAGFIQENLSIIDSEFAMSGEFVTQVLTVAKAYTDYQITQLASPTNFDMGTF
jgi:hypothetical protein